MSVDVILGKMYAKGSEIKNCLRKSRKGKRKSGK
jgi:hypothetical protein